MSSSISYEYLNSIEGVANGLATLDGTGKVPLTQIPSGAVETFKGEYADLTALTTAYPTGNLGDYAYVTADLAFYYWNSKLTVPAWVNQNITLVNYNLLTASEKSAVPYIIIP